MRKHGNDAGQAFGTPLPLRFIFNQVPSMRERFRTIVAQCFVRRQSVQQAFPNDGIYSAAPGALAQHLRTD